MVADRVLDQISRRAEPRPDSLIERGADILDLHAVRRGLGGGALHDAGAVVFQRLGAEPATGVLENAAADRLEVGDARLQAAPERAGLRWRLDQLVD
ncbi:MAG: hypothetical protein IPM06_17015 [Rhizobiales bacterium]|nr:hypothetical protein [Hyphomicrobiales bacterium]